MKQLLQIFYSFFKIGAFTFGGGYAMIPIIEKEIVDKHGWLTKEDFIEMLAIVQSLPGPIAINMSVYVGNRTFGFWGGLMASFATALPSFIIILLIAIVFTDVQDNPTIQKIFMGIRPAVVALMATPIIRMVKISGVTLKTAYIPILGALAIWLLNVSPIFVILAAALIGIIYNVYLNKTDK